MSRVSANLPADGGANAAIADLVISYTTDNPGGTANGTAALGDGDATVTGAIVNELAVEVTAKINAILAALRASGIIQA